MKDEEINKCIRDMISVMTEQNKALSTLIDRMIILEKRVQTLEGKDVEYGDASVLPMRGYQ